MSAGRIDIYIGGGRDETVRAALGENAEKIERKCGGKPYIQGGDEFNISHSGDITVCAVSSFPVGVDIERIKERDISKIVKAFDARERQKIEEKTGEEKLREFYRIWTVKEAVCKLKGCGISRRMLGSITADNHGCFLKSYIYAGEYILTVCAKEEREILFHGVCSTLEEI